MKNLYKISSERKFRGIFKNSETTDYSAEDLYDDLEGETIKFGSFTLDLRFLANLAGAATLRGLYNNLNDEVDDNKNSAELKEVKKKTKSTNNLKYTGSFKFSKKMSANKLIKMAEEYKGSPYKLGGEDFSGIDCSGLVVAAANRAGVAVGDTTAAGFYDISQPLGKNEKIKPGYAMFWTDPNVKHVAIVKTVNPDGTFTTIESTTDGKKGVQNLRRKLKPGREIRKLPFINS